MPSHLKQRIYSSLESFLGYAGQYFTRPLTAKEVHTLQHLLKWRVRPNSLTLEHPLLSLNGTTRENTGTG